jgi:hypothetical protein
MNGSPPGDSVMAGPDGREQDGRGRTLHEPLN